MIKAILFDFDGTLVNTNDVIITSFQHTFEHYLGHTVPEEKITSFFGEILRTTMEREFPMADPDEAMEIYRKYQSEHADKLVKIFPGIVDMLEELTKRGYRLSVVTSRTKDSCFTYMNQFDIGKYFESIISCEDTNAHKPEPEPILLALKKLGIEKEEAIMVGDGMFDIGCANNAGVKSVLVDWRITGANDDESCIFKADYEISEPIDMIELLEKIK